MGLFSRKPSFCTVCNKELTTTNTNQKENGTSKVPYVEIVILKNKKNTMKVR